MVLQYLIALCVALLALYKYLNCTKRASRRCRSENHPRVIKGVIMSIRAQQPLTDLSVKHFRLNINKFKFNKLASRTALCECSKGRFAQGDKHYIIALEYRENPKERNAYTVPVYSASSCDAQSTAIYYASVKHCIGNSNGLHSNFLNFTGFFWSFRVAN